MPSHRNIALTVHELEEGEFYWVLMEAAEGDAAGGNARHVYEPLEAAPEPYASYSNALVAGVAVLRRLFGADGRPAHDPGPAGTPREGRSL